MTVQQLADTIGMTQSQLSKVEKDSVWIGKEYLAKLAAALRCPISDFFREGVQSPANHPLPAASNRLPIWDYAAAATFVYPSPTAMENRRRLPKVQRFLEVDRAYPEGSFALEVSDEAMSPLISKGMAVIVDIARVPQPSDIVVVFYREGEKDFISLRYFHDRPQGRFEGVPRNRAYRTLSSNDEEAAIVGVVSQSRQDW